MHIFDPNTAIEMAEGTSQMLYPEGIWQTMARLQSANIPMHISEVTIPAPANHKRGRDIQAVIAHNLYRLWFSIPNVMGITWWNLVDDCGAPGEPLVSGLFMRDMEKKPAYDILDHLINNEWKTKLVLNVKNDNVIRFRGFRGCYKISWNDSSVLYELK